MENASILNKQSGYGKSVTVTFDGEVAIIRTLCGENRLNFYFIDRFNAALDEVERNSSAKVLITSGDEKFYNNGIDLDFFSNLPLHGDRSKLFSDFLAQFKSLVLRILTFPLPTIAAINGHAFAGGAALTLAHDYRVMTEGRGFWCLSAIHLGIEYPPYLVQLLKDKLSGGITFTEAVVLGRRYTGKTALESGIVHNLCDGGADLLSTAKGMGRSLVGDANTGYNREYLASMKRSVHKNILEIEDGGNFSKL